MRSHWRGARVCLALLVAAGSAHAQPPGDSIADGAVAVAVARETAASGFVGMTQARLGKQLYVERVPVATATDVVAITRQASPEKTYLGVILLPDADARLRSRSEAMLTGGDVYVVLLVEGRLVASAKLDGPIGGTQSHEVVWAVDNAAFPGGSASRVARRYPSSRKP
jgi:hypothetical protein